MGFLKRIFWGRNSPHEGIEIVSRSPSGKFKVGEVLKVMGRQALIGEVVEGIVYPAYKVKGRKGTALVYRIEKEHKNVEFAAPGDKVVLILEGRIETSGEDEIEVYQS